MHGSKIHLSDSIGTVEMNTLEQKEQVFEAHEKSKGVAYLLWFFFGWLGVHRFYAGKTGSGLGQLLLSLSVVGLVVTIIWWLIDAFLIPDMINQHNLGVIDMIYGPEQGPPVEDEAPQALASGIDERRQAMLDDLRQTGYRKERPDPVSRLYR
ncbi:TM2 domain-containing protein [Erythrobacter sp. SCSIO 43205]|nr:TM2 domain-containing protein [Erythrobacter sp. SCSIO 43205]